MRNAETALAIIQERGKQGLPLERLYRLLFNPELYLQAYNRLYRRDGAMTPGATPETVDGMSMAKIGRIIEDVKHERYRWTPVRRIHIPKRNGKTRPLGIPTWGDKLLQEVIRSILEAYYEPQFSDHSHGFRPDRGCHTALREMQSRWPGMRWFIEGDIAQFFDSIDHEVLIEILGEKIHDNRFLRLIRNLLESGYLEDWVYGKTYSGTPQGGVVSPILANIYLDRLDQHIDKVLIPAHNRGASRKANPEYQAILYRMRVARKAEDKEAWRKLRQQLQQIPARDPHDPAYRRLRYVRYADDFLLGFAGPLEEAQEIKRQIGEFLRSTLKLELSDEKTLITHATTGTARFLGYEVLTHQADYKHTNDNRSINGNIGFRVPQDAIDRYCVKYMQAGKPAAKPGLLEDEDFTIVYRYQQEYRGIVQYYRLAYNVHHLSKLHWAMRGSLLRTLAWKHRSTVAQVMRKYQATTEVDGRRYKCIRVACEREGKSALIAQFGAVPLRRDKRAVLEDQRPKTQHYGRSEIIQRMLADECEICGSRENVEVHHIRKLADLKVKGGRAKPPWAELMAKRRRKTLVVCHKCHLAIHAGRPV
jgi:group II intron reverse transcriptase/maturase